MSSPSGAATVGRAETAETAGTVTAGRVATAETAGEATGASAATGATTAVAAGRVLVNENTFALIRSGGVKKGDVLTVAQIAGIMAAKRTPDWIPMCHPVPLNGIDLKLWLDEKNYPWKLRPWPSATGAPA